MSDISIHPAANLFPMLPDDELKALASDIKQNGLRSHLVMFKGQLLDGRNRYAACQMVGTKPTFCDWSGEEEQAIQFVASMNLKRRDLTASQKASISLGLLELEEVAAKKRMLSGKKDPEQMFAQGMRAPQARDKVAVQVGVNRQYVSDAKAIQEAAPELLEKIRDGVISIPEAKKLAPLLEEKRASIVTKVKSGLKFREAVRQVKKEEIAHTQPLPNGKYRVIYADPPWQYGDDRSGLGATGAEDHYPTMPLEEICSLPIRDLAEDDAVLFMWATFPLLPEALSVVQAWGFKYKTAFVWSKVRHNYGNYCSVNAELLLICTRGACTPDAKTLESQVQTIEKTSRHSEKPEEFRQMIDRIYPYGNRVELFRRGEPPEGWTVWGNEAK